MDKLALKGRGGSQKSVSGLMCVIPRIYFFGLGDWK